MSRHVRTASPNETSLYLKQHANNPVDWYPWGAEALARAKELDRPIFLSIGYSACHWCHVMEHESFEDEATAKVMNEHFVCIKVDREERPDLDTIYMNALQVLTREGGGWPLSVFLTPDLTPFYARHLLPARRPLRPAPAELQDGSCWRSTTPGRTAATSIARGRPATSPSYLQQREQPGGERHARCRRICSRTRWRPCGGASTPTHGGFGSAPKFPHALELRLLLRLAQRFNDADRAAHGPAHAGQDGPRRHVRSGRRRLPPLQRRCEVARAALREDALRQRAARRRPTSKRGR